MIVSSNDIYKKVAEKKNLNEDLVKSVGTVVFQSLRELLNNPEELSYELPKLGTFSLRFKKFEYYFYNFKNKLENNDEECLKKLENNPALYEKNKKMIEKITAFRDARRNKRVLRYAKEDNTD